MAQADNIITIYQKVLENKLSRFPLQTWNHPTESKHNLIKIVRFIILEDLNWSRSEFCEQFCYRLIVKYRLNTGFSKVYNRNIYPFILDAFPEWNIKAWELMKSRVPSGFWNQETAIEATQWLIETRLDWPLEKVQTSISNTKFLEHHLGGMLRTLKIGAIDAVVYTYPEYDWTYLVERAGYKLTKSQVAEIKELYLNKELNQRQLSFKFNVNPATIHYIVHAE